MSASVHDESTQRQTLLENWRRGAARGSFAVGNPDVGKPGPDTPAAHRKQVPAVFGERYQSAEASTIPAKGAGIECSGDCGTAAARRAGAARGGRKCGRDWFASAAIAGQAKTLFSSGGAGRGNLGGIPERARALADERVSRNAAQTGALL